MNIWHFRDTGTAYDASQCNERIKGGDLLVTPTSVGVLYKAWPVWVKGEVGAFHTVKDGTLADLDDGTYLANYMQAMETPFSTEEQAGRYEHWEGEWA